MRMAPEAGLAPRLHYIDEASRVAVMDFIEQRPLRDYPGGLPACQKAGMESYAGKPSDQAALIAGIERAINAAAGVWLKRGDIQIGRMT